MGFGIHAGCDTERKHTFGHEPLHRHLLQEKLPVQVCRPNQNEKPGGEPSICLAELIKTWK